MPDVAPEATESSPPPRSPLLMTLFAATILLSAFLLFVVQPLIARFILPWFGGAAAVWTTCLLFFQAVLVGGYAYAHVLASRVPRRAQAIAHVMVLACCLFALPIIPSPRLAPPNSSLPTLRVLLVLAASVGLPYFALSATSPLVQHWFAERFPVSAVYRLYALSNVGSLAALVSYPFIIEPALSRRTQATSWSWLFAAFAILCATAALSSMRRRRRAVMPTTQADDLSSATRAHLSRGRSLKVLVLCMLASTLLLAATNKICQDIAPVPFLFLLPLTLYLVAFIVCFEYPDRYRRAIVMPLTGAAILLASYVLMWRRLQPIGLQVTTFSAVTFFGCLFCLGEVARLRPPVRELTHYYLLVSIGGVIGACFVTLVAPVIFTQWIELHVCLIAIWVLGLAILLRSKASPLRNLRNIVSWLGLGICTSAVIVGISFDAIIEAENRVLARRSFYGVLTVEENRSADPRLSWRALFHNGTIHGTQFLHPDFRRKPTSYYDEVSGAGVLMRLFRAQQPRRVGVIGLGAGTVATYGKTGDTFVFYELDPDVIDVARTQFTFLNDSPANVVTIAGDARLSLSRQEDQHFDVLVLDAFSGDAIPVHLLTTEAFALYRRHLAPGGVIAIHLTNKHLDLGPVAWAVCKQAGLSCVGFLTTADQSPYPSAWALASEDRAFLHSLRSQPAYKDPKMRPMQPWTDDYAPLFPVFRHPWRSQ